MFLKALEEMYISQPTLTRSMKRRAACPSPSPIRRFMRPTDYQKQDVVQLRIRMEAFCEIRRQRDMEGMRMAQ